MHEYMPVKSPPFLPPAGGSFRASTRRPWTRGNAFPRCRFTLPCRRGLLQVFAVRVEEVGVGYNPSPSEPPGAPRSPVYGPPWTFRCFGE